MVTTPGPTAIDKDRFIFTQIQDDDEFKTEKQNRSEYEAYNLVLLHARQFSVTELENAARRDIMLKDLFKPVRKEYQLELIYFEGRLRQLREVNPPRELADAGVKKLYEAWMIPQGEREFICLLMTELPPELDPQKNIKKDERNQWVGFAGYSFKLMQYESQKPDPKFPGKNIIRRAPVLMGRSPSMPPDPQALGKSGWQTAFLPMALSLFGGLALLIVLASWYFRRGDRSVLQNIDRRKNTNPFSNGAPEIPLDPHLNQNPDLQLTPLPPDRSLSHG
ncbi:MAG: hypothetical protein ACRCZF_13120 [Gemmataceae bacterium]